jgi:hypothetical protein
MRPLPIVAEVATSIAIYGGVCGVTTIPSVKKRSRLTTNARVQKHREKSWRTVPSARRVGWGRRGRQHPSSGNGHESVNLGRGPGGNVASHPEGRIHWDNARRMG